MIGVLHFIGQIEKRPLTVITNVLRYFKKRAAQLVVEKEEHWYDWARGITLTLVRGALG